MGLIDFHSQYDKIPVVYESARLNDNVDGTGGITVAWNSDTYEVLPVGASIVFNGVKYSLLEPYCPSEASAIHVRYEPTFLHPLARLTRVPFYISSRDSVGNALNLYTSSFTGLPRTIAQKLCDFMTEYGEMDAEFKQTFLTENGSTKTWTCQLAVNNANSAITVDFDGCSIKAAASRIADALGCNVFFDWNAHVIRFIAGSTISGEYYNCFRVLGGTANMAKRTLSGLYAPVTQRLMLNENDTDVQSGSIMVYGNPSIRLTTDLIFDDIYPKLELYVSDTMERLCYLTDENGDRIPDTYTTVNGEQVVATWKTYSKWYVKLEYADKTPYYHDTSIQIQDKPLCILFQPDYSNVNVDCPLAGRQFEVVYFDDPQGTREWEEDDVTPSTNPVEVPRGYFRIIFTSEGDTIVPTKQGEGVIPKVTNKVTLVNVAVETATDPNNNTYKEIAQSQLKAAASEVIGMMTADKPDYTGTVIGNLQNVMLGMQYTFTNNITGMQHSGVVTSINADLDTGVAQVTVGSWRRKTLTGGIRDKIDSISINTKAGDTVAENNETSISKTQFDALWKTTKKGTGNSEVIQTLQTDIEAIKQQSDAKFEIIYGNGTPTKNNEPAATWISEGTEAEHVQDIYYDINRAAASTGGRAWRWQFFQAGETATIYVNGVPTTTTFANDTYEWEEILDLDTRASLEKIRDVADDGILSAGSEKSRIYIEWRNAAEQYNNTLSSAYDVDVSTTLLSRRYWTLWRMLNGESGYTPYTGTGGYSAVPSWLSNIGTDTVLSVYGITAADYRTAWNGFYEELSSVMAEITGEQSTLITSKISYFISNSLPQTPYNEGDLWLNGDTLYMCTNPKTASQTAELSDWTPVTSQIGVSITNILAEIVVELEDNLNSIIGASGHPQYATVYMQDTTPSSYDIWLNTGNNTSLTVGNVTISDTHIISLFMEAYSVLGEGATFRIYKSNNFPPVANKFDLYMRRSTFHDNFTNSDIDGSLGVWVYSEEGWVKILDDTTGILQNYGDHIIMAVYGTSTVDSTRTDYASGITTASNYAEMFASAVNAATGTSALAAIRSIIVFENGHPTGVVKIDADRINANGKTISLSAGETLAFSGGTISFTGSTVNINAGDLNVDAENVNWKGTNLAPREVITNGTGSSKVVKFSVDNEGNVTMNNATMNSASVTGRIQASSLAIQEDAIIPSLFSEGVVSRKDGVYTKILAGKFEIGTYSIDEYGIITDSPKYRTSIVDGKPLIEYLDDDGNVVNGLTGDNTVIIETDSHDATPVVIKSVANSWNSERYSEIDSTVNPENVPMSRWLIISTSTYYKFVEGYVITRTGETETKTYNIGGSQANGNYNGRWFVDNTQSNNTPSADYMAKNTTKYYTEESITSYTYWKTEDGVTYEYRVTSRKLYTVSNGVMTYVTTKSEETRTGRTRDGSDSGWIDGGGNVISP